MKKEFVISVYQSRKILTKTLIYSALIGVTIIISTTRKIIKKTPLIPRLPTASNQSLILNQRS